MPLHPSPSCIHLTMLQYIYCLKSFGDTDKNFAMQIIDTPKIFAYHKSCPPDNEEQWLELEAIVVNLCYLYYPIWIMDILFVSNCGCCHGYV